MPVFDFRDASLKGDRRWSGASKLTSYAPVVVLTLALLSIIEVILGVVWIVSIQSASDNLTFPQVIQPLIIPALSFFNTIPSLHLHILARSNRPLMAMIFSGILAVTFYASAIVFLPPCVHGNSRGRGFGRSSGAYAATECPYGSRRDVWAAMIALQLLSAVLYSVHFGMAWYVRRVTMRRDRDEREGRVMVVIDPLEKAKREEEARQRWREIVDL